METTDYQEPKEQNANDKELHLEECFMDALAKTGGAIAAFVVAALIGGTIYCVIWAITSLCTSGYNMCVNSYNKWFGSVEGTYVGTHGLVYNYEDHAIIKTRPNRIVLDNVDDLEYEDGDSIGIISQFGKYGLLNLNTAQFVVPAKYEEIWAIEQNRCLAFRRDSVYTLDMSDGSIITAEARSNICRTIRPLYLNQEEYYDFSNDTYIIDEQHLLLYEYTDDKGRKGLMDKSLQRITPPIYSVITPLKADAFFCVIVDGDTPLGVVIDNTGNSVYN